MCPACRSARVEALSIPFNFPQDGEYEIQIWLTRNRNEEIEGLRRAHEVHLMLDREHVRTFTVRPPADRLDHSQVDKHLKIRLGVAAGPHDVAVTFPKTEASLLETMRQPTQSRFNMHRHPRTAPAVFQVSVTGPYDPQGAGETPSRRRIFVCSPAALSGGGELRAADPLPDRAPGVSPAGRVRGFGRRDGLLPERPSRRGLRRGHREGPDRRAGQPGVSVPDRA